MGVAHRRALERFAGEIPQSQHVLETPQDVGGKRSLAQNLEDLYPGVG